MPSAVPAAGGGAAHLADPVHLDRRHAQAAQFLLRLDEALPVEDLDDALAQGMLRRTVSAMSARARWRLPIP
ncbi:hypothetical protein B1R27_24005 [Streptomyces sp. GKU 895]|nr:hypothetical protein B1R27_24005 [Streptomyces sp. GKU 895]